MSLRLNINGEDRLSASDPLTPLVDVLRDEFFLTGAKPVCREGFCGACTVLLDGRPVMSCLMPVGLAEGCAVLTVESLAREGVLSSLQQAMEKHDAVQCGMCFPGMLMTLTSFLEQRAGSDARGHKDGPGRKPLPLHWVRTHRRRGALRRIDGLTRADEPCRIPPAR